MAISKTIHLNLYDRLEVTILLGDELYGICCVLNADGFDLLKYFVKIWYLSICNSPHRFSSIAIDHDGVWITMIIFVWLIVNSVST